MKKKLLIIFLLLVSVFSYAYETNIVYYKSIDNNINIRNEPNTNCKKLGQLFKDDIIKVYQDKSNKEWLYCYIPKINDYGFCYAEYFEKFKPRVFYIIDKLLEKDAFYIEMVETGNVGQYYSNIIFDSHFTKLEQYSEEEILELLIFLYKYDLIYDSTQEGNVLTECVERNYLTIVEYLLQNCKEKELINSTYTAYYGPPILFAILRNHPEMLELLLKYGANPNEPARNGKKMFYWINQQIEEGEYTEKEGTELRKILLKYGYIE